MFQKTTLIVSCMVHARGSRSLSRISTPPSPFAVVCGRHETPAKMPGPRRKQKIRCVFSQKLAIDMQTAVTGSKSNNAPRARIECSRGATSQGAEAWRPDRGGYAVLSPSIVHKLSMRPCDQPGRHKVLRPAQKRGRSSSSRPDAAL